MELDLPFDSRTQPLTPSGAGVLNGEAWRLRGPSVQPGAGGRKVLWLWDLPA